MATDLKKCKEKGFSGYRIHILPENQGTCRIERICREQESETPSTADGAKRCGREGKTDAEKKASLWGNECQNADERGS